MKSMKFSVVVFDTAPTGHTLRLLSFPSMMEKGIGKFLQMQNMGTMLSQFSSMLGTNAPNTEQMQDQVSNTKELIDTISQQFKDPV